MNLDNHLGGAEAENYRAYELELVAPHCGRHVLEIGSGFGEFAARLRGGGVGGGGGDGIGGDGIGGGGIGGGGIDRITVSDTDPICLAALRDRFAGRDDVDVLPLDVTQPLTVARGVPPVDTVLMMNVLEHVADDVGTLRRLAELVGPGGRLVVWVPGYEALYGDFDRAVGHVRRYTPVTVRRIAELAGLRVDCARPVNVLGGLAWWVAVRIGGQTTPRPWCVRTYDRFVIPATRAVERVVPIPFGQSVLCVATVPPGLTVPEPAVPEPAVPSAEVLELAVPGAAPLGAAVLASAAPERAMRIGAGAGHRRWGQAARSKGEMSAQGACATM